MAEQPQQDIKQPDPKELSRAVANIAEKSQRLMADFMSRQAQEPGLGMGDPLNIGQAFVEMMGQLMTNPARLAEAQMNLWNDYMRLWQNTAQRMLGEETAPLVAPDPSDRRFKDDAWQTNEVFDYIKQSYLLTARWVQSVVGSVEGLDEKTARKVDFYTRQFVDAMAPTNFAMTNPEVLRATAESGGENLLKGLDNLLSDIERGKGKLAISMTDTEAFKIGQNIAATPGKVVYQNDLIQLIQYDPSTPQVLARPLMVIPPWINKYYILDLKPKNSFVKWAVDQGHTVFMLSWVNPDEKLAGKSFADYMKEGPLAALEVILKITGEKQINAIGYCLGGTLLATMLAYMAAKKDHRIATATYFTTMVDFDEAGELEVFIDEEQIAALEDRMNKRGFLEGHEMATTFNMLRANDLIWSFVINNYLLGKEPFPFDLLFWNSDSTRMPAAMHSYYLRNMYQNNKLIEPGGLVIDKVPIDLAKIDLPTYILATREDHIAPWKSAFAGTRAYSGPVRFVLAASGHIAGVVNPPASNKYCHWTNAKKAATPDAWLASAQQVDGSWWPDWHAWISKQDAKKVKARTPGGGKVKPIEEAPGSYVQLRLM
ncbi:MAG: class I poly(R)-hydroxyalkanoic acid synthase [Alphaproteobacteria bacterium]|nr:class I poly(R)-hydroxyalkanoic acid synthase [Alphaproteobacteria bacterium]